MQQQHISDDDLDLYAVGKLPADAVAAIEEHLLECDGCRARAAQSDEFAMLFRTVATLPDARPMPWWRLWRRRALGAAAATAAVATVLAVMRREPSPMAPAIVTMQAMRGPEAPAEIDAGRPAILVFDIEAAEGGHDAQVVDALGKEVLKSPAEARGGRLSLSVGRLSQGMYWVRVYRAGGSEPVVEYGIKVR
jgi:hypothetical protein